MKQPRNSSDGHSQKGSQVSGSSHLATEFALANATPSAKRVASMTHEPWALGASSTRCSSHVGCLNALMLWSQFLSIAIVSDTSNTTPKDVSQGQQSSTGEYVGLKQDPC